MADILYPDLGGNGKGVLDIDENISVTIDIPDGSLDDDKLSPVPSGTFKGRISGSTGPLENLTGTQATTLLNIFTDVSKGLVPASGGGTTSYLRADGTWGIPAGGGGSGLTDGDKGDITVADGAATFTIDTNVITNTKLAQIATASIKGRVTAGTGNVEDLSATQVTALLNPFTDTLKGLTPASGGGTVNFLRADGSWAVPPSSGLTDGDKGDIVVSGIGTILTIDNNVVSNTKLAQVATQTFKGRTTASTGNVEDLTATQATAMLNPVTASLKGLVPASGGGTANFLRADATWAPPMAGPLITDFLYYVPSGEHAAIAARTSTTDLTTYLNAAYVDLAAAGGGILRFPAGRMNFNTQPNMMPINTTIQGVNKRATEIRTNLAGTNVRDGSIFWREEVINGSTAVNLAVRDLKIYNTNAASNGAGLYDGCGTYLQWSNVEVQGFKFGAVFDQTELAEIDLCHFHAQVNGGGGFWCVNGPDIRAGVTGGFTNRLSITRCQFNHSGSIWAIIDDGGISHYYNANNINGGRSRFAGVEPLYVGNGEWESVTAGATIIMHNTTLFGGTGAGACIATFEANVVASNGSNQGMQCISGNRIILIGNQFAVPPGPAACITGTANVYQFENISSYSTYATVPLFEGPGTIHIDGQLIGVMGLGGATAVTVNMTHAFKRNMGEAGTAITITVPENATTAFPIGTWMEFQQNSTGQMTFVPASGSVGIFSEGTKMKTAGTHAMVRLYKFAINSWNLSGERVV